MKPLHFHAAGIIRALTVLAVAAISGPIFGGTVITGNLPANTAIVNISGTQDGAASYNGDQSLWYHPFYTGGAAQLLQYTVQPGTYSFRVVDPADAASLFPSLTPTQTNQIFTAWTYNSPWVTDYLVFDGSAATNTSVAQLFDGAFSNTNGTWSSYGSAAAAYAAAVTGGFCNLIRPGPPNGRDGLVFSTTWTFTNVETLIFAVPDYALSDNAGGVSVLISPASLPLPVLAIHSMTDTVTLLWPTNAIGYNLEQCTNLPAAGWDSVTNAPVIVDTNNSVTLPVTATGRFFRLHQP